MIDRTMGRFTVGLRISLIKGEKVDFLVFGSIDFPFVGLETLGDMGIVIRCKEHELHHEHSGVVVRCTTILMEALEKEKN